MTRKGGPRPKHVPMRTCVACRVTQPKRQLIRVVRTLAGPVEVDPTGKKNGRGAYLCPNRACWTRALKSNLLDVALRTTLTPEDWARLAAFAETLGEAAAPAASAGA